jgi:DNA repair exonuclease SbcCD ATPase subunit
MKIISLIAENVKRLTAVEITPDGNVVQITGRNGQGKTSVLDSIWWALTGTKHIQAAPIRKGADEARIRLDLGEIKVTRTFRRKADSDGYTTAIAVEKADGARFPSPQTMIDALLGELSFDPLAFARMKPKDQFEALRRFVPEVDFEAIDAQNKGDFERRTEINRLAKQERAAAQVITVPVDTPEEEIDESALVKRLDEAGQQNTQLEQRRANRDRVASDVRTLELANHTDAQTIADMEKEIGDLRHKIAEREKQVQEMKDRLAAAPPLPPAIDTTEIRAKIEAARKTNTNVRALDKKLAHVKRAQQLESESEQLTGRMKDRDEAKRAAIAAAKMPIEGLAFGEGVVLLNSVPFEQASDAEQLRASVAIAAALNPKLRVIRIRDGSLLDDQAMRWLGEFAQSLDMQIWIERVDSSGSVGFVIEDGHVKAAQTEGEAA